MVLNSLTFSPYGTDEKLWAYTPPTHPPHTKCILFDSCSKLKGKIHDTYLLQEANIKFKFISLCFYIFLRPVSGYLHSHSPFEYIGRPR